MTRCWPVSSYDYMLFVGNVNSDSQDSHQLAIITDRRYGTFLPIPNSASGDYCH